MADETTQADAAALVAMSVADLTAHLDVADLATLQAALEAERAGQNRKGAIAALEAAIAGHPELAQQAAETAEEVATEPTSPDAPAENVPGTPAEEPSAAEPVEAAPEARPATHFLMTHPDSGTSDAFVTDAETGALLVLIGREVELFPHGFVVIGETAIEA